MSDSVRSNIAHMILVAPARDTLQFSVFKRFSKYEFPESAAPVSKFCFLEASTAIALRDHPRTPHDATHSDDLDFKNATKTDPE
jgi:hypothetical protein